MANNRGVKVCEAKGRDDENRTANVFTHNLALSGCYHFFVPTAVLATPILLNCSSWVLINAWNARQTTMIMDPAPTFHSSESVFFVTDLNYASHIERSLTAAKSHISSASMMSSVSKICQNRPIRGYASSFLVYPERPFVQSLPTGVLSLSLSALFLFLRALFSAPHPK